MQFRLKARSTFPSARREESPHGGDYLGVVEWPKNSCGLEIIDFQEASEALAGLDWPGFFTDPLLRFLKQDHVSNLS